MASTVSKSELKARLLAYLRRVEHQGEELVVTSHGRPVARVVPIHPRPSLKQLFGDARKRLQAEGIRYDADELTEPMPDDVWSDL